MSNRIPPLVCSTPPPMDFDEDDRTNASDDFEPFESADGVYGQFDGTSEPNTPKHSTKLDANNLDLPIPNFVPFPTNIPIDTTKPPNSEQMKVDPGGSDTTNEFISITDPHLVFSESSTVSCDISIEQNNTSSSTKDRIEFTISEPPPVDIGYGGSESQSPKNSRGDSPLSIEFSPGNLSEDDDSIDFQINESRYDDNTSLPSLKFDAINISKSATPVMDDKTIVNKNPVLDVELPKVEREENSNISAFESTSDLGENNAQSKIRPDEVELSKEDSKWDVDNLPDLNAPNNSIENQTGITKDANEQLKTDVPEDHLASSANSIDYEGEESSPRESVQTNDLHDGNDDLSSDFQPFESFSNLDIATKTHLSHLANDEPVAEINQPNEEIMFEADFTQANFAPVESTLPDFTGHTQPQTSSSSCIQNDGVADDFDDDFEDFQDFTAAEVIDSQKKHPSLESNDTPKEADIRQESKDDEDDFEEFGDFNDFQEVDNANIAKPTEQLRRISLSKIDDKLKSVLDMMFPTASIADSSKTDHTALFKLSDNDLTLNLREIDTAKALEYQWLQSNIKNSLVKSLGIDSRNILYGEKWNNSMPRFAANLGFGPLEPLKPTKFSSDISSTLTTIATKSKSSGSLEKFTSTNQSGSDVPAVKFDWNSSGLVNPLDASHAHTLLLDLDQLVVVANLDKIKLDSSSPCSSASLTRLTTTTAHPTSIAHNTHDVNIATATTATPPTNNCVRQSYLTTSFHHQTDKRRACLDDKYFDVLCLDHERTVAAGDFDDFGGVGGGGGIAWINHNMKIINDTTMDNMIPLNSTAIATNNINFINATNCVTNTAHVGYVNNSHNDMFDQYLDCRVKEILYDREAETIHATEPNDSNGPGDATSTEQNSITTEKTIVELQSCLSNINDDLKQTSEYDSSNSHNNNYRPEDNYATSAPTLPATPKLIPLKETHIFTPSKSEGTISRSVNKTIEKSPIDFDYEIAAAGIVINEQVVKKEYRDIVYNPEAQIKQGDVLPSETIMQNDGRSKVDSSAPVVDPNKSFRQKTNAPEYLSDSILNIIEKRVEASSPDDFNDFQQSAEAQPPLAYSAATALSDGTKRIDNPKYSEMTSVGDKLRQDSFDDEFSDFQSVPPTIANQPKSESILKSTSRTETPNLSDEMILSPAVLLPQAIKLQSTEPKINWPSDSQINPDELARLEQLFPQATHIATAPISPPEKEQKEDDDWSDFVSVPPSVNSNSNQNPATTATKLRTISKPYDEDDWSDFVSSAPASNNVAQSASRQPWTYSQMPPPQFSSWNQPSAYNSLASQTASHGGFLSMPQQTTSQQLFNNNPKVPTMSATNLLQSNSNNSRFLQNGHMNQTGVAGQLHQQQYDPKIMQQQNYLQYQQQKSYSNSQKVQQQPFQQYQQTNRNINMNPNVLKSQLNVTPSISLIPDLSFAAPKSYLNRSRTNTNNRK